MTMVAQATSFHGLSDQRRAILLALRQHRILTSDQIWRLCVPHLKPNLPGKGSRISVVLNPMRKAGMIDFVPSRRKGRVYAWFLTRRGWELTMGQADARAFRQHRDKAAGASQLHTLGVNDVGLAFVRAARVRGDRCESADWEHEIAHEIGTLLTSFRRPTTKPRMVVSDALLHYEEWQGGTLHASHRWLIELDRSGLILQRRVEKIEGYVEATRHRSAERWGGSFPPILWIVEGSAGHPAESELQSIVYAAHDVRRSSYLRAVFDTEGIGSQPPMYFTTLDLLIERGPFESIWRLLADPTEPRGIL